MNRKQWYVITILSLIGALGYGAFYTDSAYRAVGGLFVVFFLASLICAYFEKEK